jgi:tRNA(Ile)-lysidine synthase
VVVAVSGGGDSVGLLRGLHSLAAEFDLRLSVAHLDHGTRGEEGLGDARFVAELAAALNLPFDLGHWRATRSGHFEADARAGRYAWLASVAKERTSRFVAVGQTLDDQAETILHRIVRGTGLRGLAGMPARRSIGDGIMLVRPLLGVTRVEVRNYLEAIGQGFREDSTNQDTSRTRARIRLELLPELAEKFNPNVAGALVRLGKMAADAETRLERLARHRLATIRLETSSDRVVFDLLALTKRSQSERRDLIRLAWREANWPEAAMDATRWRRLANLGWMKLSVGEGIEAEATADRLILTRPSRTTEFSPNEPIPLAVPGWASWDGGRIGAILEAEEICDESVDLDAVVLPLTIRRGVPGDRFEPLGLGGRSQPLNDFFRGRKVASRDRNQVPIVCDRAGIIWVAGHRIADRVRLTDQTRRTLGLRFERT